ncbi:MAG: endonuclease, partial [Oscillospiraceae bacterium]|nr:endonuclease [Oscillospiraceae bacterium]
MKHAAKRSFSLLLALAMIVSLFAGVTISASAAQPTSASEVVYVTSGNYIYNWGKRDTVATFLTTYAQSYYTGSYSYATLSALTGSSTATADAIYSSALGSAIHDMLVAKQTTQTSYSGTTSLYKYTDCTESKTTSGSISSYYSGTAIGPEWDSGSTWNREHTWPDSKGLNGSDENDIMMLRPTSTSENSSRSNKAYGSGSSYYDPNQHGQSLHGDVARLMLQHLMRWGNTDKFYGTGGVIESRAVLLQWMQEDPVDT